MQGSLFIESSKLNVLSIINISLASVILAGLVLCLIGISSYQQENAPGVLAFAVFAVVLGGGLTASGSIGLIFGINVRAGQTRWVSAAFICWAVAAIPWLIFAAKYTGQQVEFTWQTVALLLLPLGGLTGLFALENTLASILNSLSVIYALGIVILGAALLIRATRSYVKLSAVDGLSLVILPVAVPLVLNFSGFPEGSMTPLAVAYAIVVGVGTALLGGAVFSRSVFDQTPATKQLGEQAISAETADLIFIIDDDGTVLKQNPAVIDTLRSPPTVGARLTEAFDHSTTALETTNTISLSTVTGTRQYDPQVSPITDAGDRQLGTVLSLRDVTDRRVRQQRLTVLNRVLRHNLRNEVEVIKSHVEELAEYDETHTAAITAAANRIAGLGDTTRTIDQFISVSNDAQAVDIAALLREIQTETENQMGVTIECSMPETAPIHTNKQALRGAFIGAVETASVHDASSIEFTVESVSDGYNIYVSDDGTGISQHERELVNTGSETPLRHGVGLELWQLNWAVATVGGELSLDTNGETTMQFTVPDCVVADSQTGSTSAG